jgi:hypothetical protein
VPELLSFILPEYPTAKAYNSYYARGFLVKYDKMRILAVEERETKSINSSNGDGAGHSNVGKALRIFKGYPEIQGMKFVSGDVKIKINHYD